MYFGKRAGFEVADYSAKSFCHSGPTDGFPLLPFAKLNSSNVFLTEVRLRQWAALGFRVFSVLRLKSGARKYLSMVVEQAHELAVNLSSNSQILLGHWWSAVVGCRPARMPNGICPGTKKMAPLAQGLKL